MRRAEQLATAVATLREFVEEPGVTKRDIAGVLQGFAFCVVRAMPPGAELPQ